MNTKSKSTKENIMERRSVHAAHILWARPDNSLSKEETLNGISEGFDWRGGFRLPLHTTPKTIKSNSVKPAALQKLNTVGLSFHSKMETARKAEKAQPYMDEIEENKRGVSRLTGNAPLYYFY